MPRRRVAAKREILPDPKFGSEMLTRFINVVMVDGKKSVAERVVYGALTNAAEKLHKIKQSGDESGEGSTEGVVGGSVRDRILEVFKTSLDNIRPTVEVKSRRVGGATYQVPVEVRQERSMALAMRWLVQSARSRSEKGMLARLASEIVDAHEGRGSAVKKRDDTHRMAKANQAFAHFRWT